MKKSSITLFAVATVLVVTLVAAHRLVGIVVVKIIILIDPPLRFSTRRGGASRRAFHVQPCSPAAVAELCVRQIIRAALFFIMAGLVVGCAPTPDPVDQLVTKLSSSHGLWQNGISPILGLPATASTEQVVSRVFQMTGFDRGHVTNHRILKVREVHIPGSLPDVYTAVVVYTDSGRKIVLMKHEEPAVGWWSRVYHIESSP